MFFFTINVVLFPVKPVLFTVNPVAFTGKPDLLTLKPVLVLFIWLGSLVCCFFSTGHSELPTVHRPPGKPPFSLHCCQSGFSHLPHNSEKSVPPCCSPVSPCLKSFIIAFVKLIKALFCCCVTHCSCDPPVTSIPRPIRALWTLISSDVDLACLMTGSCLKGASPALLPVAPQPDCAEWSHVELVLVKNKLCCMRSCISGVLPG